MKNKMIYALGAMMLVGVASCDLTEKPSSFYEKDTYFVTEGKAQMAVVGIYDCLETTDYYGQNIMPFFGSDDMFMVRGTGRLLRMNGWSSLTHSAVMRSCRS